MEFVFVVVVPVVVCMLILWVVVKLNEGGIVYTLSPRIDTDGITREGGETHLIAQL